MPNKIFKIYDNRTNFWQWDTNQKLIVLDESITEVRFSNRNMEHSKRRIVYTDNDGKRVCNVPDILLQLPKDLMVYACIKRDNQSCSTVSAEKFEVYRQPIPSDYVCEQDAVVDAILGRLEILENLIEDIKTGNQELKRFDNIVDAAKWAKDNGVAGGIVVVYMDDKWVPHIIENEGYLSPICDCSGEVMNISTYVPRLENDKLIFELQDTLEEEKIVIDIDGANEWGSIAGSEEELSGNYIWEAL